MITIADNKQDCCGCGACAQGCPKGCIAMRADKEGFLYPEVDKDACTDCGLCEKVCPELNPDAEREPKKVLAAVNKDEQVRLRSSSGGVFYLLAEEFIREGGVVFGARFDENWQVVMDYAETLEGVQAFMGSKYVQARTGKAFIDAKQFLQDGRKVLFSGTPCQIAGLRHFLRKEYDNLLTVDIVCHGTPSPEVWGRYLDEVLRECGKVKELAFRNKAQGWRKFSFKLAYSEEDETLLVQSPAGKNPYMKAFLKDLILRPACYGCKFKSGRSHSDITLADFWGIWNVNPQMDDDKGASMVFINSEKGEEAFRCLTLDTAESDYETAKKYNKACRKSPEPHPKRTEFFARLEASESLTELIDWCTTPTYREKIRQSLSQCKHLIIRIVGGGKLHIEGSALPTDLLPLGGAQIVSVVFRNKASGWRTYSVEVRVKDITRIKDKEYGHK